MSAMDWRKPLQPIDPAFVVQVATWLNRPDEKLLNLVWAAYDQLIHDQPSIDGRDLERSISQLLEPRVRDAMSGFEPFYVQHGTFERETMAKPPAQPPEYDLAFVWRADERVIWPLEAKVLETPGRLADYDHDLRFEFLTCRYAPFTASGAMVGYLLSGTAEEALQRIAVKIGTALEKISDKDIRPQRISQHARQVPKDKPYPADFTCYHLVLEFTGLRRDQGPQ
ncbi:hypothetical protein [Gluconobacter sp. Dm-44]|uniref:hypothetical protein n=1 Tax=Gluconobacter sp. Dm-44 TaxID=2799805 RepID=UPI001B8C9710|nr:hypothetical protein [Gluconobacter sp. Dm-44]MBS1060560.1 hypothetical protein [Gluconobacter sp. Dm-44]